MMYQIVQVFAASCEKRYFFGLPAWYNYLIDKNLASQSSGGGCDIQLNSIYDIFKILAAVVEIALRLGILIAVAFIIYGGVKFITSQGDPQGITNARDTIVNAVIGLVITLIATTIVSFVAGRF